MSIYKIETDNGTYEVEVEDATSSTPSEGGSALDKIAEMGAKGPLTMAREAFSKNPEPVLNALPTAGAVGGGLLGGPAGAATGAMAGETLKNFGKAATTGEAKNPLDAIAEMGMSGATAAAGEAAFPLAAKGLKLGAKGAAKGLAKVSELLTGTPSINFERVAERPGLYLRYLLPEKLGGIQSAKKAGKALGQVEKEAGLVVENLEPTTGEAAKGLKKFIGKSNPATSNQSNAERFFDRVSKGEELTPQETLEAYKATSDHLKTVSRWDRNKARLVEFEKALRETIGAAYPAWDDAMKKTAESISGRNVTNFLPRTATGKPSIGRLGFNALLFGGGVLNPALPATIAATAPIVHGGAAALGGGVVKAATNKVTGRIGLQEILRRSRAKK